MRPLINVRLEDRAIEHLNEPAKLEAKQAIEDFGRDLLAEASRLEAIRNPNGSTPEITSSFIKDARVVVRGSNVRRRRPPWEVLVQLGTIVAGLVTGILTQYLLSEPWGPIAVVVAFGLTVILEAWLLVREYSL